MAVMALRAALWLLALSPEPGRCSWDALSERFDGIGGGGGGHGNGKGKWFPGFYLRRSHAGLWMVNVSSSSSSFHF